MEEEEEVDEECSVTVQVTRDKGATCKILK